MAKANRLPRRKPPMAADDELGGVMTEYVIVLVFVSLGCALALIGLGAPLVSLFRLQRTWLLLPFP